MPNKTAWSYKRALPYKVKSFIIMAGKNKNSS